MAGKEKEDVIKNPGKKKLRKHNSVPVVFAALKGKDDAERELEESETKNGEEKPSVDSDTENDPPALGLQRQKHLTKESIYGSEADLSEKKISDRLHSRSRSDEINSKNDSSVSGERKILSRSKKPFKRSSTVPAYYFAGETDSSISESRRPSGETTNGGSPNGGGDLDENENQKGVFTTGGKSAVHSRAVSNTVISGSSGAPTDVSEETDDNINVVVRVRPLNIQESEKRNQNIVDFPGDGTIVVDNNGSTKSFTFNVLFEPEATQPDVFEHSGITKLIEMATSGYSCTAFAFGQTGSGKTHTITGPPQKLLQDGGISQGENESLQGLIPRSFRYLYNLLTQNKTNNYRIFASYLEIYNEQVIDLLNPNQRRQLMVRWSKNRGFYVENLFVVECEMLDDLLAVLEEGLRNRQTGAHNLNEFSSRSHSVLTLNIDSEIQDPEDENLYITKHGKLTFVDLAGSEKVKDSGATGEHLTETYNINRSLLVLGNCISALGDAKKRTGHIPYRDSKLTKLLADSLGGNGVTLMIACVSPASANSAETMNTLRYANRAKKIKNKPVVKMDPREKLILSLKREIKILRQENHYLRQQLEFPAKPKGQLQKENDMKFMQFLKEQERSQKVAAADTEVLSPSGSSALTDSGLYEMLQEYMIENETLRSENSDMHQNRDRSRREQQLLARDNERLQRKIEELAIERGSVISPLTIQSFSAASSRHSSQFDSYPSSLHSTPIETPPFHQGGPFSPSVYYENRNGLMVQRRSWPGQSQPGSQNVAPPPPGGETGNYAWASVESSHNAPPRIEISGTAPPSGEAENYAPPTVDFGNYDYPPPSGGISNYASSDARSTSAHSQHSDLSFYSLVSTDGDITPTDLRPVDGQRSNSHPLPVPNERRPAAKRPPNIQAPLKPPHRLAQPVSRLPGPIATSPREAPSYATKFKIKQELQKTQENAFQPVAAPRVKLKQEPPAPQQPVNPAGRPLEDRYEDRNAPRISDHPWKSKQSPGGTTDERIPPQWPAQEQSQKSKASPEKNKVVNLSMNEQLKRELMELEGAIHNQSRVNEVQRSYYKPR